MFAITDNFMSDFVKHPPKINNYENRFKPKSCKQGEALLQD
jgi:hypothetical protein